MSNIQKVVISEDEFDEKYRPVDVTGEGERIAQTYNEAKAVAKKNGLGDQNIWTIIEGDEDEGLYACADVHAVNKIGFVITEKAWETGREEAVWYDPADAEELDD